MVDSLQENTFVFQVPDLRAGVVNFLPWEQSPINSMKKCKNAIFSKTGYLIRRPGLNQISTQLAAGDQHIGLLSAGFGGQKKLYEAVARDTGDLIYLTAWDGSSRSTINTISSTDFLFPIDLTFARLAVGTEVILLSNPGGNVSQHTVTAAAVDPVVTEFGDVNGSPPQDPRFLVNFLDRIWAAGVQDNGRDSLYFSNVLEGDNWNRTVQVIRFEDQGEFITGIAPFKDRFLIVGTEKRLYILSVGTSPELLDWDKSLIANDIGIGAGASVSRVREDVFFVDDDLNVRSFKATGSDLSGSLDPVPISLPIKGSIADLNQPAADNMVGQGFDGRYWISGSQTAIDGVSGQSWSFDGFVGAWTGPHTWVVESAADTGGNVLAMTVGSDKFNTSGFSHANELFIAVYVDVSGSDRSKLFKFDSSLHEDDDNDNTTTRTIEVEIITRPQDVNQPHLDKEWEWIEVEYGDDETAFSGTGSFDIYVRTDLNGAWRLVGSATYDTSTKYSTKKVSISSLPESRLVQFRFIDSSNSDGPKIRRYRIAGRIKNIEGVAC